MSFSPSRLSLCEHRVRSRRLGSGAPAVPPARMRASLTPVALILALLPAAAWAQTSPQQALPLRIDALGAAQAAAAPAAAASAAADEVTVMQAERPASAKDIVLTALRLRTTMDLETVATGEVTLSQGDLVLTTDALSVQHASQLAVAKGRVTVRRGADRFSGSEAQVNLKTREGVLKDSVFDFARTGAGGQAKDIEFFSDRRLTAQAASYTSCRREEDLEPDWVLSADKLSLDFENNEGRAEGATLRFLGVPILYAPVLSFPSTDARKSGWLPPSVNVDNRSGIDLAVPYYFNLAPNYDLTLTPGFLARRGASLQAEFRYLGEQDRGRFAGHWVPDDRAAARSRGSVDFSHSGELNTGLRYDLAVQRATDDEYWKDFSRVLPSQMQRLLPQDLKIQRQWTTGDDALRWGTYARAQTWQVLQSTTDAVVPPYQRLPQVGLRVEGDAPGGARMQLAAEYNRFVLADRSADDTRPNGQRLHVQAEINRHWDEGWGWISPTLRLNAASYQVDAVAASPAFERRRLIPTVSLDSGLRLERPAQWLDVPLLQTLEPRLHYVYTPFRAQTDLPLFDTAARDFNELSIYADNAFTGVDRISDAQQLTVGATSRLIDPRTGAERLRLGAAQRYLFREQKLTPDGLTTANRFSDLLLYGSGSPAPDWRIDGTLQFNTDTDRFARSITSVRWQPKPFHTLAATYRFARDLNEQIDLAGQWPLYRGAASGRGCQTTLYGVGRTNYSVRDRRLTDSLLGLEWDAGCWIGRIVVERTSTARSEATTRWMFQLELIGLSRLGPSPLKVLKDNIPGYRLLREDDAQPTTTVNP
ncbi:LPS-assembly protein LptD [Ideonella paludis]|uniref:LPS-assembly protein LptD n=1 Tax=Ideonella paludis TaxID=1233411 RepID=A0ABS5DS99_9BURK|nr:LPS assembly protein LptD [Ideonella paludis]MBQ0934029.1 LPS-assembly protein LptD [Ideonella paludis]